MQTKVLEYAPQFVVDLLSARVVKLVDTRDLKSLARKGVPVRLRLRAPIKSVAYKFVGYFFCLKFLLHSRCTKSLLNILLYLLLKTYVLWESYMALKAAHTEHILERQAMLYQHS